MLSTDLGAPFRLLRRTPDLRLLLGAGLVSLTGDWLLGVGLAYAVYALTGSTLASAATLLSSFVPQMVVGSVAGVFVDRWDRKRTMVVANLLLAGGLLPLLLVTGADRIWVVYAVLATQSCVEVFFGPAEQAFPAPGRRRRGPGRGERAQRPDPQRRPPGRLGAGRRDGRDGWRPGGGGGGGRCRDVPGRSVPRAPHPDPRPSPARNGRRRDRGRRRGGPRADGGLGRGMAGRLPDGGPGTGRPRPGPRPAHHQHRRRDHGYVVRAVRPPCPARQRTGLRGDHRRP